jgi:hypothetical protein
MVGFFLAAVSTTSLTTKKDKMPVHTRSMTRGDPSFKFAALPYKQKKTRKCEPITEKDTDVELWFIIGALTSLNALLILREYLYPLQCVC